MKTKFLFGFLFLGAVLVGCGGPSDDAKLSELEDDDISDLCADVKAESQDCGGGVTVEKNDSAECEAGLKQIPDSCEATVADFNECNEAKPCEIGNNAACVKILRCALPGGG